MKKYIILIIITILLSCQSIPIFKQNKLRIVTYDKEEIVKYIVHDISLRSNFINISEEKVFRKQLILYVRDKDNSDIYNTHFILLREEKDKLIIDLHDNSMFRSKFFDNWSLWIVEYLKEKDVNYEIISNNQYDIEKM